MDDLIENENLEIRLLLEAIFLKYGYDFRNYSFASIKRRIIHRLNLSEFSNLSELQHEIIYNKDFFEKVLLDFSISDKNTEPSLNPVKIAFSFGNGSTNVTNLFPTKGRQIG